MSDHDMHGGYGRCNGLRAVWVEDGEASNFYRAGSCPDCGRKVVTVPPLTAEERAYLEPLIHPAPVDMNVIIGGPRRAPSIEERLCSQDGQGPVRALSATDELNTSLQPQRGE